MIPHIILCAYFEGYNISAVYNVMEEILGKKLKLIEVINLFLVKL